MDADSEKQRQQRLSGRQARAMTRAIDKVSEEFIENFSQTGIDEGPEQPPKLSPVRQALADREAREAKEAAAVKTNEPEFRGFAALMGGAKRKTTGAFSRHLILDDEPAAPNPQSNARGNTSTDAASAAAAASSEESFIKVRDTVGKKRGLYTSCMQRPDAAQMEEWAKKATEEKIQAEKERVEKLNQEALLAREKIARSEQEQHILQSSQSTPVRKPARTRSLVQKQASCSFEESGNTCPISFAFAKIIGAVKRLFGK
jgi:hypothetical protein